MTDLLLIMGQLMPTEMLVEEIKQSATEYLLTKDDDSYKKLTMYCVLLATKESVGKRDISEISKEIEETRRIKERMNANKI